MNNANDLWVKLAKNLMSSLYGIESVQLLNLISETKTKAIDSFERITLHEGKTISVHNSDLFIPSFRRSHFNLWVLH